MNYFIDFDGTLIDVSDKFYKTYSHILLEHGQEILEKSLYWELKRNKTSEETIRSISGAKVDRFSDKRKAIIETADFQRFDKLHQEVKEILNQLSKKGELYLITLRQSKERVLIQLKELGIINLFKEILVSGNEKEPKWMHKVQMIQECSLKESVQNSVIIGDTEIDLIAGKHLNMKTIGVLNGMRNYSKIIECSPDLILPSFKDLSKFE
jgi:phosphoglycolate phosphatase-like HAD superfamily hydrolase